MSDISDRDALEAELSRKLGKMLKAQMAKLLELMGDPPRMENVPQSFWDESEREFGKSVIPFLERLFLEQAGALLQDTPLGVDWALMNRRAIEWSQRYGFDLVRGINSTSRDVLQRAVSAYYKNGLTIGELERMITASFGPVRAEMIAVTEVTRAAARGEDALWEELAREGIEMITTWTTHNDELVCVICGPMHGRAADGRENGEPYWTHPKTGRRISMPAHPRCRCNENNTLPKVSSNGKR